jgi:hypothetical protein
MKTTRGPADRHRSGAAWRRRFQRLGQHHHAGAAAIRAVIHGAVIVGGEITRIPQRQATFILFKRTPGPPDCVSAANISGTGSRHQIAWRTALNVKPCSVIKAPVDDDFLCGLVHLDDIRVHKWNQALLRPIFRNSFGRGAGVMRKIDCGPLLIMSDTVPRCSPCNFHFQTDQIGPVKLIVRQGRKRLRGMTQQHP